MKSIAIFNNKGGVGKTTLTFHVAYALAELGHRTLLVDLDPQSNLTLFGLTEDQLNDIWTAEEPFVDDFEATVNRTARTELARFAAGQRSIHFLLKATEDGTGEIETMASPIQVHQNLGMIPGRLTVHLFEERIARRWNDAYQGEPLAIRTVTKIRKLCQEYAAAKSYDFVIIDTSPSLGVLRLSSVSEVARETRQSTRKRRGRSDPGRKWDWNRLENAGKSWVLVCIRVLGGFDSWFPWREDSLDCRHENDIATIPFFIPVSHFGLSAGPGRSCSGGPRG